MIRVASYLLIDEQFVLVEDFNGQIPDPDYIDGAIELNINGVDVLTKEMYDYVDQLWSYIAQGLVEIEKTGTWETLFPDQPTELSFHADEKRRRVRIEATPSKGRVVASADYDEFMLEMSKAGQLFFSRMMELVPENKEVDLKQMERLQSVMHATA